MNGPDFWAHKAMEPDELFYKNGQHTGWTAQMGIPYADYMGLQPVGDLMAATSAPEPREVKSRFDGMRNIKNFATAGAYDDVRPKPASYLFEDWKMYRQRYIDGDDSALDLMLNCVRAEDDDKYDQVAAADLAADRAADAQA